MIMQIPMETPSKKNSRVTDRRTGRSFPSKRYVEWHRAATLWLRSHYPCGRIDGPLKITLSFTHPTLRRKDADNGTNSVFDLLVDVGILQDDCWTVVMEHSVKNRYEKGVACCTIEIERADSGGTR
jgi:Holliday junction resolvase RusA-like endonuclease